jgi:hypothetical protein
MSVAIVLYGKYRLCLNAEKSDSIMYEDSIGLDYLVVIIIRSYALSIGTGGNQHCLVHVTLTHCLKLVIFPRLSLQQA